MEANKTLNLSLVTQWDATGEEPAIGSVTFAQSQLHLLNGADRKSTIKKSRPFPVRMKVHHDRCLLPLQDYAQDRAQRGWHKGARCGPYK